MAKQTPRQQIREAGQSLKEIFTEHLAAISDEMIRQAMSQWRDKRSSLTELKWPGEMAYRQVVRDAMTIISVDSIDAARKEVPRAKFSEDMPSIQFASISVLFEKLPIAQREFISAQTNLLIGTQLADMEKNLRFQYMDSFDTIDDEGVIEDDLRKVCVDYIDGNSVRAGADLLASKTVNEARSAFFFDDEVLQEIDAFEFVNADPVSPICDDLAGTVFAKDDPNMFRYTPPLHWNCKSYIVPILSGKLGKKEITALKPSSKKLEDSIQFSEAGCNCAGCT